MPEMKEGRFAWDSEDIALANRLVFTQGDNTRLMILDTKVTVTYSHYERLEGGRVRVKRCLKLDGKDCEQCQKGDLPQPRFGCVVLVYRTFKPVTWEIMPWLFGKDKFARLRELKKKGTNFLKADLSCYCYNETFQNVKIEPLTKKSALWDRIPTIKQEVIALYKKERPDVFAMMTGGSEEELSGPEGREEPPPEKPKADKPKEGEADFESEDIAAEMEGATSSKEKSTEKAPELSEADLEKELDAEIEEILNGEK